MGRATKGAQESGLTDHQELFCHEYLARGCSDAKGAAIAAGYSKSFAYSKTHTLVGNPRVQARIDELMQPILEKLEITAEEVLNELARVAFSRIDRVLSFGPAGVIPKDSTKLSPDVLATVAEASQTVSAEGGSIRIRLFDKMAALEKLGRHFHLWGDRVEPTGPLGSALAELTDEELVARAEALRAARLEREANKGKGV